MRPFQQPQAPSSAPVPASSGRVLAAGTLRVLLAGPFLIVSMLSAQIAEGVNAVAGLIEGRK